MINTDIRYDIVLQSFVPKVEFQPWMPLLTKTDGTTTKAYGDETKTIQHVIAW